MSLVTAKTQVVGVIGDPIGHSRSPAMHNAAFRSLGLPWVYLAFRVAPRDVGPAVAAVRALGLRGLNVTVPHKQAVLPHLDRLSARARACEAVNTIVARDGALEGDNTDVAGLQRDLEELGFLRRKAGTVVVLGAGGAARAAVVALGERARRVLVAARRPERAAALTADLASAVPAELVAADLADLAPGRAGGKVLLSRAALVVNATSLGMQGEPFAPLDHAATPADCAFYDLVYTASRTPFLAPAARLGRRVANGLGMLVHQGGAAFELWTGIEPPLAVMRRAVARRAPA